MKNSTLLFCVLLFLNCKNNPSNIEIEGAISNDNQTISYKKPDNCSSFFKTIGFTDICLANKALDIKEVLATDKACQIDIRSPQLNGAELDVLFYYESDLDEMTYFNVRTEANKMQNMPGVTHKKIDDLGDVAFIVNNPKSNTKKLVMTIKNVRISIQSDLLGDKEHCMYADNQLIKMAEAIAAKIN